MKLSNIIILMLAFALFSSGAQALRTFSDDVVTIDTPIEDDVFAAGSMVNINAPVDSATIAGGTLNVNAPVKGDVFAAGGQVYVNSDVGGKVVAMGGNVNQGGDVGTNLVAAGGQVNILPSAAVAKDALIAGGSVVNAGVINGTLTVSADNFQNTGTAGSVDFYQTERPREEERRGAWAGIGLFGLLMALGHLILGLILLRYLPSLFFAVDGEIRRSPVVTTVLGLVLMIAAFIAIIIVAITIVGIPIALIALFLLIVALMLTGIFVSFSLGRWIGSRLNLKYGDMALFVIGFVVLNILFLIPYVGGLIGLISVSLGFGAILYAARNQLSLMSRKTAAAPA
jgi:hypothetical protein